MTAEKFIVESGTGSTWHATALEPHDLKANKYAVTLAATGKEHIIHGIRKVTLPEGDG